MRETCTTKSTLNKFSAINFSDIENFICFIMLAIVNIDNYNEQGQKNLSSDM